MAKEQHAADVGNVQQNAMGNDNLCQESHKVIQKFLLQFSFTDLYLSLGGYISLQINWVQPCYISCSTEVEQGKSTEQSSHPGLLWDTHHRDRGVCQDPGVCSTCDSDSTEWCWQEGPGEPLEKDQQDTKHMEGTAQVV